MTIDGNILDAFESVLDAKTGASGSASENTVGTVSKIGADGTIWVRLAGASTDTPCRTTTVAVKPGDSVTVEVGGGSARITGNVSSPSTDDETANRAVASASKAIDDAARASEAADVAEQSAISAQQSADAASTAAAEASTAAENASNDASTANAAANGALTQLSVVENVVGALSWVSEHAEYAASSDTEVIPGKFYFTRSGEQEPYTYVYVENPTGDPSDNGYYEIISIDEAVSNYVTSHLALTDDGLWVVKDNESYKLLLASSGMNIHDASGISVAEYGQNARIGREGEMHLTMTPSELAFRDASGTPVAYIEVVGGESLFYMTRAVVVSDLRFGNNKWTFATRDNDNLSLKWLGATGGTGA